MPHLAKNKVHLLGMSNNTIVKMCKKGGLINQQKGG